MFEKLGYKALHKAIQGLGVIETKLLVRKTPYELLKHFGVSLPVKCPPTKLCPDCMQNTVVFHRTLDTEICMNCYWPQHIRAGKSVPPWDPFAPVVPARVPEHLGVHVNEPVPGVVMPLREGKRMETVEVDIKIDVDGTLDG